MGYSSGYCPCMFACICVCVAATVRSWLFRRGHMLEMKMVVYHHRELSEGERRRWGVAGGIVTARKEKMKNAGKGSGRMESSSRKQEEGWRRRWTWRVKRAGQILEMKVQLDLSKNISCEKLHLYFQKKGLLIKYGCCCLCWVFHNWFLCSLPDRAIYGSHVFSEKDFDTTHTHTHTTAPPNHQQRLINRLPQGLFLFRFYSLNTCWASIVSNDY